MIFNPMRYIGFNTEGQLHIRNVLDPNPLPNEIKMIIDIIRFQSANIKFHEEKNRIHNDQIGLSIIK